MEKISQLLALLKASLEGESYDEQNIDYDVLYADSLSHSVHTTVYNAVRKQSDAWENKRTTILSFSFDYIRRVENAIKLLSEMKEDGISAVAVKGLFLQSIYPSPDLRLMSDADIILKDRNDEPKVRAFFEKRGYTAEKTADNVINFYRENELSFEVHLFVKLQRYSAKSEKGETYLNLENTQNVVVGGYEIETLNPTEHYIYIIGHMGTHFSAGGTGFRQLCDAWLFAKKYKNEIDWKIFFEEMKNLGYYGFACNILYICEKKFSLDTTDIFSVVKEKCADCIDALLLDIYEGGVFGQKGKEQKYGRMASVGRGNIIKAIFPLHFEEEKYSYAEKHRVMLPLAWVHRVFDFGLKKFSIKDVQYIKKSKEISKRRLELFNKLGM